jgi:hypothetical protein
VALDGAPIAREAVQGTGEEPLARWVEIALPAAAEGAHVLTVEVPDAAAVAHVAQVTVRYFTGPLVKDGGFEQFQANGAPVCWQAASWGNPDAQYETKIVEGGRGGGHCGQIRGMGDQLNLLLSQPLPLTPGRAYVVRGFYQAEGAGAFLSIISDGTKETRQYDSMSALRAAVEWTPFEFKFTAKPANLHMLHLRSSAKGAVRWDDVEVMEAQ